MPANIPYCFNVFRGEKSLSSKVHLLFSKKLDVIEHIMPTSVAFMYEILASKPFVKEDEMR
jgi:hypothetical protein